MDTKELCEDCGCLDSFKYKTIPDPFGDGYLDVLICSECGADETYRSIVELEPEHE